MSDTTPTPAMKFTWLAGPSSARDIFDSCIKSLANPFSTGSLALVIKGMSRASQQTRHLAGRNSPKGEIVADGDDDTQIVSFKALDILAWMTANKLCTAEEVQL